MVDASTPHVLVVDQSGKGDFRTVGEAIAWVPSTVAGLVSICIRPGVYKEAIVVPKNKPNLQFLGLGKPEDTVLTFDRSARTLDPNGKPYGTSGSASVVLAGDNFRAENITFANSAGTGDKVGQAVAVLVSGDKCVFRHCRFTGYQDTLYAGGRGSRQFYDHCLIEGSVDFIFGHGAAIFDHCEIKSVGSGYVTAQARDTEGETGGYVFRDCDLTAAKGVRDGSVYLGRPWRAYARVVFVGCKMGKHIRPDGWNNWREPEREKTAFFGEYLSIGPGAGDAKKRVAWSHQLSKAELALFETDAFFTQPGEGTWKPQ